MMNDDTSLETILTTALEINCNVPRTFVRKNEDIFMVQFVYDSFTALVQVLLDQPSDVNERDERCDDFVVILVI